MTLARRSMPCHFLVRFKLIADEVASEKQHISSAWVIVPAFLLHDSGQIIAACLR
jgi:hypothetical protein